MKLIYLWACCVCISINAQVLHHQAFLSQGAQVVTSSGFVVGQSIGQNSPSGTFRNADIVVQQGFQHYVVANYNINVNTISTKAYPNPFVSTIVFEFSMPIDNEIQIALFDLSGKLIKTLTGKSINTTLSVDFDDILDGQYIVVLNVDGYKYSTKIIKMNKL